MVLWFLSVNARAAPPEVFKRIPRFLDSQYPLVRFSALRLLYESKHPAAETLLAEDGWRFQPETHAIENHWGSLLLASAGQHLGFDDLSARIDTAYLGLAVEKRGLIPEEVGRYAEAVHRIWKKAVGQGPQLLESFPEAGIETMVSSTEPVFCRYTMIWERYWHMSGPSFINPFFYWGRVPDEEDSDDEDKPWEWPSEEQKAARERRQGEEIERQRQLGNVWFCRELNTSALPDVVESRPDFVSRWLAASRDQLRMASTFYEGLCGVLLRKSPDQGISLYWRLKEERLPVRITVHGIERLDYFLFQAPTTPEVYETWGERLDQCRTDKELLEVAIVAEAGNGAKWLWDISERRLDSSVVRKQAQALMLLGLSSSTTSPKRERLEQQAEREPVCWLNDVARKAMESRRNNESAQHQYRRFLTAENNDQAQAAFRLLLRCADRRFWSWQEAFETSPELPEFTRRRTFFENNRHTLRNRIQANEKALAGTLFGTKVLIGEADPWLF